MSNITIVILSRNEFYSSEMDLISDLLPAVPSLLDPTSPYQNVTLLTNTFIGAFLGTFLANLGAQTVRMILGESDIQFISSD